MSHQSAEVGPVSAVLWSGRSVPTLQRNILPPNLLYPEDGDKTFLRNLICTYHITTQKTTWILTLVIPLLNAEFELNHTKRRGNISGLIQLTIFSSHPMGLSFSPGYSCENRGGQSCNASVFSNVLLFSPVNQHSIIVPHPSITLWGVRTALTGGHIITSSIFWVGGLIFQPTTIIGLYSARCNLFLQRSNRKEIRGSQ
jgi:hypothetical protein